RPPVSADLQAGPQIAVDGLRHQQGTAQPLGGRLDPAGDVDHVADGRGLASFRVAYVPHKHVANVDADAHVAGRAELAPRVAVEPRQLVQHLQGGQHGLFAGPGRALVFQTEQGHEAVTDVLVDVAALAQDGVAPLVEIAVEQVDDVVSQVALGERGKVAD